MSAEGEGRQRRRQRRQAQTFADEVVGAARRLRNALIASGTHPYTLASLHALIADAEAEGLVAPEGEGDA